MFYFVTLKHHIMKNLLCLALAIVLLQLASCRLFHDGTRKVQRNQRDVAGPNLVVTNDYTRRHDSATVESKKNRYAWDAGEEANFDVESRVYGQQHQHSRC